MIRAAAVTAAGLVLAAGTVIAVNAYDRQRAESAPDQQAPRCDGAGLLARADVRGSLRGNTKTQVLLTNNGRNACVLTGHPRLAGVAGSKVVPLQASHGTYFGDPQPLDVVPPGATAAFYLTEGGTCADAPGPTRWPELRITLPNDTSLRLATGFDTRCGIAVSAFGRPD